MLPNQGQAGGGLVRAAGACKQPEIQVPAGSHGAAQGQSPAWAAAEGGYKARIQVMVSRDTGETLKGPARGVPHRAGCQQAQPVESAAVIQIVKFEGGGQRVFRSERQGKLLACRGGHAGVIRIVQVHGGDTAQAVIGILQPRTSQAPQGTGPQAQFELDGTQIVCGFEKGKGQINPAALILLRDHMVFQAQAPGTGSLCPVRPGGQGDGEVVVQGATVALAQEGHGVGGVLPEGDAGLQQGGGAGVGRQEEEEDQGEEGGDPEGGGGGCPMAGPWGSVTPV